MKYLDLTGLGTFWTKVKNFVVGSHNWDNIDVENYMYYTQGSDYPAGSIIIANGGTVSIRITRIDITVVNNHYNADQGSVSSAEVSSTYTTSAATIVAGGFTTFAISFSDYFDSCDFLKIKVTAAFSSPDSRTVTKTFINKAGVNIIEEQ